MDNDKGQDPKKADDQESTENEQQEEQQSTLDQAALAAELKKVRKEAASYRTKLRKAEEADEARKKAEMTETERIKAELAEAQTKAAEAEKQATETMLRMSVVSAAAVAGFNDPSDAWSMIDQATLEVSEDGTVTGVDEAIAELLKGKPYLAKSNKGTITPTNPQSGPQSESDADKRARIYGGSKSGFWGGGGVVVSKE